MPGINSPSYRVVYPCHGRRQANGPRNYRHGQGAGTKAILTVYSRLLLTAECSITWIIHGLSCGSIWQYCYQVTGDQM